LPTERLQSSDILPVKAAQLKALHSLYLADAWVAACATQQGGDFAA
jgi:hypothetical protein